MRVPHLEVELDYSNEIKLYELQVKITCTISKLITIMLSQSDNNVSHYRVVLIYCCKNLHNFNGNDKLSDHGIKKDSFITMFLKYVMSNDFLNSLKLNKKRDLAEISSEDVKYDKRFKGNKSNVLNVEGKIVVKFPKSHDNVQKQANISMSQLDDSYSSVKEQQIKLYILILEKGVHNVIIPYVEKSIKVVSQVPFEYSIVKSHNIFKDSFVTRVTKFQTTVGIFVL